MISSDDLGLPMPGTVHYGDSHGRNLLSELGKVFSHLFGYKILLLGRQKKIF
jgi:hypothetical protein